MLAYLIFVTYAISVKNIARGTADPEIDSVTWTKFSNHMAAFALVSNLPDLPT